MQQLLPDQSTPFHPSCTHPLSRHLVQSVPQCLSVFAVMPRLVCQFVVMSVCCTIANVLDSFDFRSVACLSQGACRCNRSAPIVAHWPECHERHAPCSGLPAPWFTACTNAAGIILNVHVHCWSCCAPLAVVCACRAHAVGESQSWGCPSISTST